MLGSQTLGYTPTPIGLYCLSGGNWQPCNPSSVNGFPITPSSVALSLPTGITFQSIYLLNEGSGTSTFDSSGNGYTGTLGTSTHAPTWYPQGLNFMGTAGQYSTIPCAAISGTGTLLVWGRYTNLDTATQGYPVMVGTDTLYGLGFIPSNMGEPVWFGPGASAKLIASDKVTGDFLIAVSPGSPAMYINSQPVAGFLTSTGAASPATSTATCTTNAYIGQYTTSTGPFNGYIYAVAKASTVMTQAQVAQMDQYVRYQKALAGFVFAPGPDYSQGVTEIIGDSRVQGTGESNLLSGAWAYLSGKNSGGITSTFLIPAIGGARVADISSNLTLSLVQVDKWIGPTKTLVIEGGINDLTILSSPSTIYSTITGMATTAHTHGMKVVGSTIEAATSCTGTCATNLATLNASILSGCRSGTFDGCEDFNGIPWLTLPSNSTCFSDGLHETTYCNSLMAPVSALAQLSASGSTEPFWLPVVVPYQVLNAAATTQTLNLLNLYPGQQICGAKSAVTTAFAGTSISALTATVGDSGGTATQYLASQSLLTATKNITQAPNFVGSSGTVQLYATATGANLSALTAGSMTVQLCVVNIP